MDTNIQNPTSNDSIIYDPHVVVLIDVLGQRDSLRAINRQPENREQEDALKQGLRDSLGVVLYVRKTIEEYIKQCRTINLPADYERLSPEQKNIADQARDWSVSIHHFSDTILVSSPIRTRYNRFTPRGVYALLSSCALSMMHLLAKKIPIRGAIEIGMAVPLDGEIYGPALALAHDLESRVAGYPRIVVGDGVLRFLNDLPIDQDAPTILTNHYQELARTCLSWIAVDVDGILFLDFFGTMVQQKVDDPAMFSAGLNPALTFVGAEHERFKQKRNQKLAARYGALKLYLETRRDEWMRSIQKNG